MNAPSRTTEKSLGTSSVLLIGPDSEFQRTLARELQTLSASPITATDFPSAGPFHGGSDRPPGVVILPEGGVDPASFEEELAALRVTMRAPDLVPIAFGRTPSEDRRSALRSAGIELALFGSFGRHCLRFQVNRALSRGSNRWLRGELRAPKEWRTRTFSFGREKGVRCYSLSSGGGYFVTPRPWIVGSDILLELPVGRERILVDGRVLYTSPTGDERALPGGMAVGFRPLSDHFQQMIRADVAATQARLQV